MRKLAPVTPARTRTSFALPRSFWFEPYIPDPSAADLPPSGLKSVMISYNMTMAQLRFLGCTPPKYCIPVNFTISLSFCREFPSQPSSALISCWDRTSYLRAGISLNISWMSHFFDTQIECHSIGTVFTWIFLRHSCHCHIAQISSVESCGAIPRRAKAMAWAHPESCSQWELPCSKVAADHHLTASLYSSTHWIVVRSSSKSFSSWMQTTKTNKTNMGN